jgi:hypothetical protein
MRVTLSASMPTAKPQQLDKPQFDELPILKSAALYEFMRRHHHSSLLPPHS